MHLRLSLMCAAVSVMALEHIPGQEGLPKMTRFGFVSTAGCLLLMASVLRGKTFGRIDYSSMVRG